jgi:hypothetical protein
LTASGCRARSDDSTAEPIERVEHVTADSSFAVRGVSLSTAAADRFDSTATGTRFPSGTKAVAARYVYRTAGPGTHVELRWSRDGHPIFSQGDDLEPGAGAETWLLRMGKDGTLPDGAYALEILENGRSAVRVPFEIGAPSERRGPSPPTELMPGGAPTSIAGSDSSSETATTSPVRGTDGPARAGDEPGETVTGLVYENPAAGLTFSAPSFAWRFDPAPRADPGNAVVVGRFSPSGAGLGIVRVQVRSGVTNPDSWSREVTAADSTRRTLGTEKREIGGRSFVLVRSEASSAQLLTACVVAGGRGYLFELRTSRLAYASLEREFLAILKGARFG